MRRICLMFVLIFMFCFTGMSFASDKLISSDVQLGVASNTMFHGYAISKSPVFTPNVSFTLNPWDKLYFSLYGGVNISTNAWYDNQWNGMKVISSNVGIETKYIWNDIYGVIGYQFTGLSTGYVNAYRYQNFRKDANEFYAKLGYDWNALPGLYFTPEVKYERDIANYNWNIYTASLSTRYYFMPNLVGKGGVEFSYMNAPYKSGFSTLNSHGTQVSSNHGFNNWNNAKLWTSLRWNFADVKEASFYVEPKVEWYMPLSTDAYRSMAYRNTTNYGYGTVVGSFNIGMTF